MFPKIMPYEAKVGRWLLAATMVAFGAKSLVFTEFVNGLEPVPTDLVPAVPWAWLTGALMVACGLGLLADRTARAAALLLAGLLIFWVATLQLGPLIASLKNQADDTFHTLALAAAFLVLAAQFGAPTGSKIGAGIATVGRILFGVCLVGFGVMHFVFFQFTADFIPAWIPAHEFWAAATGVAQIAAGLAVLSGILARLATILTAAMYASWAFLVHIPRIAAKPASHAEWSSLILITALCAAALVVAAALAGTPPKRMDP